MRLTLRPCDDRAMDVADHATGENRVQELRAVVRRHRLAPAERESETPREDPPPPGGGRRGRQRRARARPRPGPPRRRRDLGRTARPPRSRTIATRMPAPTPARTNARERGEPWTATRGRARTVAVMAATRAGPGGARRHAACRRSAAPCVSAGTRRPTPRGPGAPRPLRRPSLQPLADERAAPTRPAARASPATRTDHPAARKRSIAVATASGPRRRRPSVVRR